MNPFDDSLQSYATLTTSKKYDLDVQPCIFDGLSVASFGNSRRSQNPFFKLKAIAMDTAKPIDDRMAAARYMSKIPHKDTVTHTSEAIKSIISEETCPVGERYFFFSNNMAALRLENGYIVRNCHIFYFNYSAGKNHPLMFRLLSAQYIYLTLPHTDHDWIEAQNFIISLATDKEETVRIRAEAADILCREITSNDTELGKSVIQELGELYDDNKLQTIYTNSQNAHDKAITESVMNVVRTLALEDFKKTRLQKKETQASESKDPTGFTAEAIGKKESDTISSIYAKILKLVEHDTEKHYKVNASLSEIIIYPAKFEGLFLVDILRLVWNKIQQQDEERRKELEKRTVEELYDMGTCGTGYVTRLINILQGYIEEENFQIKINVKDQLRSNILARITATLRNLPPHERDMILEELADVGNPKPTTQEFLETYSVYDEVKGEFVDKDKLIDLEGFNDIYNKTIANFIG